MSAAGAAFPIADLTQVSAARRSARQLAEQLGFSETRAGTVALVVTELGTNLAKHARGGEMLLRRVADPPRLEVLALDRGPGIPDVALSQRDGYSTAGSRGEGLGAVMRLSEAVQIHSNASGTAVLAIVARDARQQIERPTKLQTGGVRVNAPGEQVCGDEWSAHVRDERVALMVADGLGHGLAAHDAARTACATFDRIHTQHPLAIVEELHRVLRPTRGAAVGVFTADLERGTARYCGLGNVSGTILLPDRDARHSLVSMNGTAGHTASRIQEFHYPFPPGSTLVMHSDGVSAQWDLSGHLGLRGKHPTLIAGVLYRDFRRGRDDATVAVLK